MAKRPYNKLFFILPYFLGIVLLLYVWFFKQVFHGSEVENRLPKEIENDQLLILVWTWPFGETFPLDTCESHYKISGCSFTTNRSLCDRVDAVVFHHRDVMYSRDIPRGPRPHYQRWVWFNIEPPIVTVNLNIFDNLINMTMTYKEDSDIFLPYGYMKPLKEPQSFKIPTKSKLVAWVVSKWYQGTRRASYYEELKKHIDIDVYGHNHTELSWDEFDRTLIQYKFYLAFENCEHKDYITEKLWSNAFITGLVPVVLGPPRENYERFIPPTSFIHVDDFSSPKELAQYLLDLDKDNAKYEQYFSWRSKFVTVRELGWDNFYCKACRELQQSKGYKAIASVGKWFRT
ncbi:4-galactosyl-N-acetylglucosaminide 3-alpha-L-fucosyltransferase 9-like [Hyperolius riggenbachi]|uniref:4-galactosyl-N-acetylglucosaminide 3-alpha-L-fucosyltransferase 9-like n=1 Tax=Hyperolius riggenbachi TaxID=752182 RepID=UPI0035A2AC24